MTLDVIAFGFACLAAAIAFASFGYQLWRWVKQAFSDALDGCATDIRRF